MDEKNNKQHKKDEKNEKKEMSETIKIGGEMLTISTSLAAGVIVGFFAGNFLDNKLNTFPWFTIIMLLLGIIAGFRTVFKMMFSKEGGE